MDWPLLIMCISAAVLLIVVVGIIIMSIQEYRKKKRGENYIGLLKREISIMDTNNDILQTILGHKNAELDENEKARQKPGFEQ